MVDFKKRLAKKTSEKSLDPIEIYDKLDRASDKGPLRPIQVAVLKEWHKTHRDKRDVILKLNTGQGKTLIGLIMLQSKLNQGEGPALYLCPNNFLVTQTYNEAIQFGVSCVTTEDELPDDFMDGRAILVTTVQKLFNGLSKFGIGPHYTPVPTILMDDAHTCIQAISDSCVIRLKHTENAYSDILSLFDQSLKEQGAGTHADIRRHEASAFLAVPYWDWIDRYHEVTEILSKNSTNAGIKFAWPLLKDKIKDCLCIMSGAGLEISPYLLPLNMFGSYHNARHRIFMSATVTDDSLLIKGLGLSEEAIKEPLVYKEERWSGEKLVIIPSLIHSDLTREQIVSMLGKSSSTRKVGVVVLSPSFESCKDWQAYGSMVARKEDIDAKIKALREKNYEQTLVIVNRYDGIDLPDDACRILVLDQKPHPETLTERYLENCRSGSEVVSTKVARSIEQGMGRGVRGEKDYCVLILIGPELVKVIRAKGPRKYFSPQTQMQIDIGVEAAGLAKDDISEGSDPISALRDLINKCLKRDEGWKEFYKEKMDELPFGRMEPKVLHIFAAELQAESKYQLGRSDEAVSITQKVISDWTKDETEKGWYLQEIARYLYPKSKAESNKHQIAAHSKNRYLLKPKSGMTVTKVTVTSQKRIENMLSWIARYADFEELVISLDEILCNLRFMVDADKFEKAFDDLGKALGFECQRPDKEWGEGPDNLWALRDGEYLLVECKSEAALTRAEVYKEETGQMNNACSWFDQNYVGAKVKRIMIVPTLKLAKGAGFNESVEAMRKDKLGKLVTNVKAFFGEFKILDLKNVSHEKVQELINLHELSVEDILGKYTEKFKLPVST
jgi:replicative superfamily II helicase